MSVDHTIKPDPADYQEAMLSALRIVDAAKVALAGTFGADCVPLICFGLTAEVLGNIRPETVPPHMKRKFKAALALTTETFKETAEALHAQGKKIIMVAPAGMRLE